MNRRIRKAHVITALLALPLVHAANALAQEGTAVAQAAPESAEPAGAPSRVQEATPVEAAPAPQPSVPAQNPPVTESAPAPASEEPAPAPEKPAPYSLPFQLRPAVAASVIRFDSAFAFYEDAAKHSGFTNASMLLGSYKVTESFAPMVRLGVASNSPPVGDGAFNFLNPVLGATYALKPAKPLRLGLFLGLTLPIGSGGGNTPDAKNVATNGAGIRARSAMDNAMFAVNDFTIFPGVDFAYVAGGFTVQAEATLFQLARVRGDKFAGTPDSSRTNFTTGLHAGYFFIPELSVGAELRHQRWLSTPKAIEASPAARDTTTVAFGVRGHFKLNDTMWLRPALAFAVPLDKPMTDAKYKILQLDIPFYF